MNKELFRAKPNGGGSNTSSVTSQASSGSSKAGIRPAGVTKLSHQDRRTIVTPRESRVSGKLSPRYETRLVVVLDKVAKVPAD